MPKKMNHDYIKNKNHSGNTRHIIIMFLTCLVPMIILSIGIFFLVGRTTVSLH